MRCEWKLTQFKIQQLDNALNKAPTHLVNFLLAGGTTLLSCRVVVPPMIVALGEKANALADVANRANRANFFMVLVPVMTSCASRQNV